VGSRVGGPSSPSNFLCHESDRPPFYIILSLFFNIADSRGQAFILQVLRSPLCTQNSLILISTIKLVISLESLEVFYFSCMQFRPTSFIINLFFIIHNHGLVGSWVGGCIKILIFKSALIPSHHSRTFSNMH
jgi:hypothetical protein